VLLAVIVAAESQTTSVTRETEDRVACLPHGKTTSAAVSNSRRPARHGRYPLQEVVAEVLNTPHLVSSWSLPRTGTPGLVRQQAGPQSGDVSMSDVGEVCCLCGKSATEGDPITREHVPPKQFYPKSLRTRVNLWVVPTHRSCNNKYKADEEYFYHASYPLVANVNPRMADVILRDLKRRAKKPQTRTLLRGILQTQQTTTGGGIVLPPGMVGLNVDAYRLQQVAIKIGRCLFYRDHNRIMPYENCKDIRLCESEQDVPECYRLSWELSKVNVNSLVPSVPGNVVVIADTEAGAPLAACRQVFEYRSAYIAPERLHLYTLMFWEAFTFCMAFQEPTP
jgi:hypothetical protein